MPDELKLKLKVEGDELTIEKGSSSLLGKLIASSKGKVKIKTPFGEREIKEVKNHKGRVLKQRPRKRAKITSKKKGGL